MTPRIELAEVLSFRLKLPRTELESLPTHKSVGGLRLAVSSEGSELIVSVVEGDCSLRFRTIGTEAVLTEVVLANDALGHFFQRVLGPLMVRFSGDLNIRLTWNTPERNAQGDFAEVKITRGRTTYTGLNQPTFAPPPSLGGGGEQTPGGNAVVDDPEPPPPSAEEGEIRELLQRAKTHWEEYQRLKKRE